MASALDYVDGLVKEYLLFRGFNHAFHAFESDCSSDRGRAFNVDEVLELILDDFVPKYECRRLISLCEFLESNIFCKLEPELQQEFTRLRNSIYKKYIVHALQNKQADRVADFFKRSAHLLRRQPREWNAWFSIHYLKNPETDLEFELYFSQEWSDALRLSLQNLLSTAFHKVPLPSILRFNLDRVFRRNLQLQIRALQVEKARLEALLSLDAENGGTNISPSYFDRNVLTDMTPPLNGKGDSAANTPAAETAEATEDTGVQLEDLPGNLFEALSDENRTEKGTPSSSDSSTSSLEPAEASPEAPTQKPVDIGQDQGASAAMLQLHSTFGGHEAPITCCRFSPDGESVASSSRDGTVRISSANETPSSSGRNVTIRNACEVLCLDWEPKRGKLVLFGTSQGTVKAWNVDAKRYIFDVAVHGTLNRVVNVKCSPCDNLFVVHVTADSGAEADDFSGQLSIWNFKSCTKVSNISVSKDEMLDAPVTCIALSKDGKVLAAGSEDGMVHLYEVASRNVVSGYIASTACPVVDLKFGSENGFVWTLTADGHLTEWDTATSKPVREVNLATEMNMPVGAPSVDGYVAFCGFDLEHGAKCLVVLARGSVAFLDLIDAGPLRPSITAYEDVLTSIHFNPHAEEVVVGTAKGHLQFGEPVRM